MADSRHKVGKCLIELDKTLDSISQLQESLRIKKLMNDAKSASVASTLECLGSAYFSTN